MMKFFSSADSKDKNGENLKMQQEMKLMKEQIFRQQLQINIMQEDISKKHAIIIQLKRALLECTDEDQLDYLREKFQLNRDEFSKSEMSEKKSESPMPARRNSLDLSQLNRINALSNSQPLSRDEIKNCNDKTEDPQSQANDLEKDESPKLKHRNTSVKKEEEDLANSNGMTSIKTPFLNKKLIVEAMDNFHEELTTFDGEIRIYAPQVFREIKNFVTSRQTFHTEDIYDLVDKSAETLGEIKYFQEKVSDKRRQKKYEKMIECLLFEVLYPRLFCPDEDERARNTMLQDKFYVLQNIINFDMLDIPQALRAPSLYNICEHEMKKINTYKTPSSKICCFSNCVNNLVDMYFAHEKRKPTSDELFPMLVYLTLRANPDNLRSNVEYIYKYVRKSDLLGESGFLITNLEAAVSFLDSVDGRALNKGVLEVKNSRAGTLPSF